MSTPPYPPPQPGPEYGLPPAPPRRHRLRKWLLITSAGVVVFIGLIIALGAALSSGINHAVNRNSAVQPSSAAPASTPSPATPSGPDMLAMGGTENIASNGTPAATITVASPAVSTQSAEQYGSAPQNGYFLTVSLKVTANQAFTTGFDINPLNFYALVGTTHYGWDNGNAMGALSNPSQELSATTLAAGESTSGKLAFDVSSPHGYIVYAPNLNGQPLAEWQY